MTFWSDGKTFDMTLLQARNGKNTSVDIITEEDRDWLPFPQGKSCRTATDVLHGFLPNILLQS